MERGPDYNPNAKQMEVWFYDSNGYKVVIEVLSEYSRSAENYVR